MFLIDSSLRVMFMVCKGELGYSEEAAKMPFSEYGA